MHDSLSNMYQLNFTLRQHYGYQLEELDNMIPFEREIYVSLLLQHLEHKRKNKGK